MVVIATVREWVSTVVVPEVAVRINEPMLVAVAGAALRVMDAVAFPTGRVTGSVVAEDMPGGYAEMETDTGAGVPDQFAETWNVTEEPACTDRADKAESVKSAATGGGGGGGAGDEEVLPPHPKIHAEAAKRPDTDRRKLLFM